MVRKTVVLSVMTAALVSAGVFAHEPVKAPIRLTDVQMDQLVAGAVFTDTVTTTQTLWFHGYSNNPAAPNSPGASQVSVVTVVERTLDCKGGSINSCYAEGQTGGLNPNTNVVSTKTLSSSSTLVSGPGRSFNNR